tara:strand:+ start:329 stop:577 length:249 start_codon:yes stop_codon:yes gene_type:complete
MKCAIIGSTKIAEVHAKHLIANGVREITFISRSHLKREKIILNVKRQVSKRVLFFHGNIKELKKKIMILFVFALARKFMICI